MPDNQDPQDQPEELVEAPQDQLEAEAEVTQEQPEAEVEQPQDQPVEVAEAAQEQPEAEAAPARRRTARSGRATRTPRSPATAAEEPPAEDEEVPAPRLRDIYRNEIVPSMMREYGFTNPMQVPRIQKIVINIGLGEALTNGRAMENATRDLATITGQKPIITRARKSIAGFKIREGNPIGTCVTLRGARMYHFLDRFINMSLPRIRDFRGIARRGFDGRGNFSIGIQEQIIFPEIDYNQVDRIRGLQVTITTTARDDALATRLLEGYGMPFVREV